MATATATAAKQKQGEGGIPPKNPKKPLGGGIGSGGENQKGGGYKRKKRRKNQKIKCYQPLWQCNQKIKYQCYYPHRSRDSVCPVCGIILPNFLLLIFNPLFSPVLSVTDQLSYATLPSSFVARLTSLLCIGKVATAYLVQYVGLQCSAVQWSEVWLNCSAVKWSEVQCSAVQCSAVQCSAVQCSAVQCTVLHCSLEHFWACTVGRDNSGREHWNSWPGLLCAVQHTVYSVHCMLYSVHCTLYNVHCTLYIVHYTLYNIHLKFITVHSALHKYTVYKCRCSTVSVDGWVFTPALCDQSQELLPRLRRHRVGWFGATDATQQNTTKHNTTQHNTTQHNTS